LSGAVLERRLRSDRERLAAYARVLPQLNPDMPLSRGYVRVIDTQGRTLTSRAEAAKEAMLNLRFHDGDLAVGVGGNAPSRSRPVSRNERRSEGTGEQGDLF